MFKSRLLEALYMIIAFAIIFLVGGGVIWGIMELIRHFVSDETLSVIAASILMLAIATVILNSIWKFIKWLFVEPFIAYRKKKKVKLSVDEGVHK